MQFGKVTSRGLTLALFVAGVAANHVNDASTADDFTVLANPFYRRADFHLTGLLAEGLVKHINIVLKRDSDQAPVFENLAK